MNLPELGGLELLSRLAAVAPNLPVLVLSMHAEPLYVTRAMEAGARGYVSKNIAPDELVAAIRQVAAGGRYVEGELAQALVLNPAPAIEPLEQLTPRDLEIMRLLARGRSLSEIADALGLGYKTIANTCTQIKAKLGVNRTADLVRVALQAGIC
jgi:two-component system invasion response regulator UvrY